MNDDTNSISPSVYSGSNELPYIGADIRNYLGGGATWPTEISGGSKRQTYLGGIDEDTDFIGGNYETYQGGNHESNVLKDDPEVSTDYFGGNTNSPTDFFGGINELHTNFSGGSRKPSINVFGGTTETTKFGGYREEFSKNTCAEIFNKVIDDWALLYEDRTKVADLLQTKFPFLDIMCIFLYYMDKKKALGQINNWDSDPLAMFVVVFQPFERQPKLQIELNASMLERLDLQDKVTLSRGMYLSYAKHLGPTYFNSSADVIASIKKNFLKRWKHTETAIPQIKELYSKMISSDDSKVRYKYDVLRFACHLFRSNFFANALKEKTGALIRDFGKDLSSGEFVKMFENPININAFVSVARLFARCDDFLYTGETNEKPLDTADKNEILGGHPCNLTMGGYLNNMEPMRGGTNTISQFRY